MKTRGSRAGADVKLELSKARGRREAPGSPGGHPGGPQGVFSGAPGGGDAGRAQNRPFFEQVCASRGPGRAREGIGRRC